MSDNWIKVDDNTTAEGIAGEQYVRAGAIIRVGTLMRARNAPPVPGSTVTVGRVYEAEGTLFTLIDGSKGSIKGLTPSQVIALADEDDLVSTGEVV